MKAKMKWRPVPETLARTFEKALDRTPKADRRKMFGCPCAFVKGNMFAGLHQENMVLKLSEDDRARLLAAPGAKPFEPMPGRPMREYVVVPPSVLAAPEVLGAWLEKAFAFASALPAKGGKKKPAKAAASGRGARPPGK